MVRIAAQVTFTRCSFWLFASLVALLAASSSASGRTSGKERVGSDIDTIVIHAVGGPICASHSVIFESVPFREDDADFWKNFLLNAPVADAHYVVGRRGYVVEVLPALQIANHTTGLNDRSIGIELVNRGDGLEAFPEEQIRALINLISSLREQFPSIRDENIIRHSDFDQRTCSCAGQLYHRRQDPGASFPLLEILNEIAPNRAQTTPYGLPPPLVGLAPEQACSKKG
jgi:N-acetylmuramoyl-L-alanine amidase